MVIFLCSAENNHFKDKITVENQNKISKQKSNYDSLKVDSCTIKSYNCKKHMNKMFCKNEKMSTIIEYDFKTKKPETIPNCTFNQYVLYKIKNINRMLYNVTISSEQITYQSDTPIGISQLFNISSENLVETTENLTNNILNYQIINQSLIDSIKSKAKIDFQFRHNRDLLSLNEKENIDTIKLKNENEKLNKYIYNINDYFDKMTDKQIDIKLLDNLHLNSIRLFRSFNHLENAKKINNELTAFSLRDIDYLSSIEKVNSILKAYPSLNRPYQILSDFNNYYQELNKCIELYKKYITKSLNDNNTKLEKSKRKDVTLQNLILRDKQTIENLASISTDINELKRNVDNFDYINLFESLTNVLFNLKNEGNFTITSDPIQAKKDIVDFKIDIAPKTKSYLNSVYDRRCFTTSIPVEGGVKFDFSTGVFLTTNLFDRQYNVQKDSIYSKITENANNSFANLSIGALMHVSKRCQSDLKLGLSVGTGINSTDLTKLSLFVGPCLFIGKQEQLIISLGGALAQVDYLKGKYKLDNLIKNTEIDTNLTEKAT